MSVRIQKALANVGLASRRSIEQWIVQGRVTIDARIAKLGDCVSPASVIYVDGKHILLPAINHELQLLLYHKPLGKICTRDDPLQRTTVFTDLPKLHGQRWISVGRLDINSSGLLLFTNCGDFAQQLMHPASRLEREYLVKIYGKVTTKILEKLQKGVMLQDGTSKFINIKQTKDKWYKVRLATGKNREVRRLWESQGIKVAKLIRIRFGSIVLPKTLVAGDSYLLSKEQITKLQLNCHSK